MLGRKKRSGELPRDGSGTGKVQELGLFLESSSRAVCLPVCSLRLCLHSPSPYWASVVNLTRALCFLVRGPIPFLWRGHFPLGSLFEIRDFQKVVSGGPQCGWRRAGITAKGSWGRFSPTNAMLFIGCMKRLLRLILGSPRLQYPPGELVCTVFACLVWGGFCLSLDFFYYFFFCLTPPLGSTNSFFASKYLKKSKPHCDLPHQVLLPGLSCGLSRGARGRSRVRRGWGCSVCVCGSPEEMQGEQTASGVSGSLSAELETTPSSG